MAKLMLDTVLFGTVEFDTDKGLWQYYKRIVNGREIRTRLDIDADNSKNIAPVQNYLLNTAEMIQKSKAVFLENYPDDETIQMFVDFQMEAIDENSLLACFGAESPSEITPQRFLQALELCGMSIDYDGECILDFCLDGNITDALLVVRFNPDMEILGITHES